MKLMIEMTIHVRKGFLPHLTNEIYKRGYDIQKLLLIESEKERDLFRLDIIHYNGEKFKGLIDKIVKYEEKFELVSIKNPIEDIIKGGLLNISGKMEIENIFDFDMKISGAHGLILEKIDKKEDSIKYSGISNNIGLISGIGPDTDSMKDILKIYALKERDSVIIHRFSGLNAFPIIIRFNHIEDYLKNLKGIESTFSAIRITYIEDQNDISLYDRIYSEISLPILFQYYDEIPLYLLIAILHFFQKNKLDFKDNNVGFIGIDISSLRLARLLIKLGCSRILGCDNNEHLMLNFEKEGGLATTKENVFSNSDLIIIFKNHFTNQDLHTVGSGQIIISIIDEDIDDGIIKEKGAGEFLYGNWMNLAVLFPGILKGLMRSGINHLDDSKIIDLSTMILKMKSNDEIIPGIFSDIHEKIPEFIQELSSLGDQDS